MRDAPVSRLLQAPGMRLLPAAAAALAWGGLCGLARGPFLLVAAGGLGAAALGLWLERAALAEPAAGRRAPRALLIAAAFGFLAMMGVGLASLGCIIALDAVAHR